MAQGTRGQTPRDRLLNAFDGLPVDRVPVSLFITDADIDEGLYKPFVEHAFPEGDDGTHTFAIRAMVEVFSVLGIDAMVRVDHGIYEPLGFDLETDEWKHEWARCDVDGHPMVVHTIRTPGGELRESFNLNAEAYGFDPAVEWMKARNARVEHFVKSRHDLDVICEYRPKPVWPRSDKVGAALTLVGERGIVLPRGSSSVFNYATLLRPLHDMLTDAYLHPELYRETMALATEDVMSIGAWVAQGGGDVIRVIGNIANGGLVGRSYFRRYVFEYEKRYLDLLRAKGARVLFHNCGKCKGLLSEYKELLSGLALESLTPPSASGDIDDIKAARAELGDNVTMVGNVDQVNLMRTGRISSVIEAVTELMNEFHGETRFIISTSDSIAPGTPLEALLALSVFGR